MPNFLHNLLGQEPLTLDRKEVGGLVRVCFYVLCTLSATCDAATFQGTRSAQQLSEVWRETFPVANVGMAPSTFSTGKISTGKTSTGKTSTGKAVPRAGVRLRSDRPHPAVARIVVPEQGATAYGSGTLIDVRENFGLVITNWHVVRDSTGTIEVLFPGGFTSKARALKVDADWDLAALVIWRPSIEPVSIAGVAPRPGDRLTICGYGQGNYRCATGRCTQYYAPRIDFPRHMVELDVEARQGDSGGPIFNEQGELAGVLFGAGQGTTLGSFGGRVGAFLATLAPDIGRAEESLAADEVGDEETQQAAAHRGEQQPQQENERQCEFAGDEKLASVECANEAEAEWPAEPWRSRRVDSPAQQAAADQWQAVASRDNLFEQMKTALAAVGLMAIVVQMLRVAR